MASTNCWFWHRLQSIFLVADEFKIYSKSSGNKGIYARISSGRKNGYVQISTSDKLKYQGTEIHIVLPRDLVFKFSFVGNTSNYIKRNYDPFTEEKLYCIIKYGMYFVKLCGIHIFQFNYILKIN